MNSTKNKILVTGVTGRLGQVMARELLKEGFSVRGMARVLSHPVAKELEAEGIEIVQGNFEEPDSLLEAFQGIGGLYLIVVGAVKEEEYVIAGVDATKKSDIVHLIYCSHLSADPLHGYENDPARSAENYIRTSGIPYTIFRPVDFMENYTSPFPWWKEETLINGVRDPRSPDFVRQFIAIKDIVFFALKAFHNPEVWIGRELNIAGDEIVLRDLPKLFSKILGRPMDLKKITWEEWKEYFNLPPLIVEIFQWYEKSCFVVDVAALRKQYPHLQTFEEFLKGADWGA